MTDMPAKPIPNPTALSQPYWDGVSVGELRLQTCVVCDTPRHYPRLLCDRCYSDEVRWVVASGKGKIHSWTIAHHPYHPAFVTEVPYTLVLVDLEEGPRAMGRFEGATLSIGDDVLGNYHQREGGADLVFTRAND